MLSRGAAMLSHTYSGADPTAQSDLRGGVGHFVVSHQIAWISPLTKTFSCQRLECRLRMLDDGIAEVGSFLMVNHLPEKVLRRVWESE